MQRHLPHNKEKLCVSNGTDEYHEDSRFQDAPANEFTCSSQFVLRENPHIITDLQEDFVDQLSTTLPFTSTQFKASNMVSRSSTASQYFSSFPSSSTQTLGTSLRSTPSSSSSCDVARPSTDAMEHQPNSVDNLPAKRNKKKHFAYFVDGSPFNKGLREIMNDFEKKMLANSNMMNFGQSSSSSCNSSPNDSSRPQYPPNFEYQSEHLPEVIPSADFSADERPRTSSGKKPPRCRLCANHGVVELMRGHKYKCLYRSCICHKCSVTRDRKDAVKKCSRQERLQD